MEKGRRLRKSVDFVLVFKRGGTYVNELFILKALPNGMEISRYGFVASKKVGKAVMRNRVRRRMRKVARLTPIKPGWDLVFIARSGASGARYQDIETAMRRLLGQARLGEGWR
jgi:ribonuclease P protein component